MTAVEYDVFVCCPGTSPGPLARTVSSALAGRGFRVFVEARYPADASNRSRRLALVEAIPDFVLVAEPAGEDADGGWEAPLRAEVERALATSRNVVRVAAAGAGEAPAAADGLPAGLARLLSDDPAMRRSEAITFDPARPRESIAILAHHLSSDSSVDDRRVMRRARRLFWIAGAILLLGVALQVVPALIERWSRVRLLDPVPPFALYWSGIGQRLEGGRWVQFPLTDGTSLRLGDQLRVIFSTSADGFAYVVSRDRRGYVSVLFPGDTIRGASRVNAGEQHAAPVDGGWVEVDGETAPETIYLIAGYDAQQNLEELIEEPEATTTPSARRVLLESTVSGLLDGRHGAAERRVWTGKLHPIDPALKWRAVNTRAPVRLADGGSVQLQLVPQPGLVSACVELRLRPPQP